MVTNNNKNKGFMSIEKKRRGRPRKSLVGQEVKRFKPSLVKMDDITFSDELFVPMRTNKKIDSLLSSEGGVMRGTNIAFAGDPGVGKSTVMLDILGDLNDKGQKVLFISGEMTSIDMFGYVKRFPKFGRLPILFMGDYIENDPLAILKSALNEGFDVVLIDSMAEVCTSIVDFHGGTNKNAETQVLNLLEKHNKAENKAKINTTFLIIQQVTKSNSMSGSNRFKHALTAVGHIKFDGDGRCIWFSKNRRGGQMDKLFFSLDAGGSVSWLFTEPHNMTH